MALGHSRSSARTTTAGVAGWLAAGGDQSVAATLVVHYRVAGHRLLVRGGQLGMERLEAWILATNLPSQRLVTQLGFVHEGTLRGRYLLDGVRQDMAVYGWQAG